MKIIVVIVKRLVLALVFFYLLNLKKEKNLSGVKWLNTQQQDMQPLLDL